MKTERNFVRTMEKEVPKISSSISNSSSSISSYVNIPKEYWENNNIKLEHFIVCKRLKGFYGTKCAVYLVCLKDFPQLFFALKVLYGYDAYSQESKCIQEGLDKEVSISKVLQQDKEEVEYVTVLHSFIDNVNDKLMDWDSHESEKKTLFLVIILLF